MLKTIYKEMKILACSKRLNRGRYMAYQSMVTIIALLVEHSAHGTKNLPALIIGVLIVISLFFLICWFFVRRLHDMDMSAKPFVRSFILLAVLSLTGLLFYKPAGNVTINKLSEYLILISFCTLIIWIIITKIRCLLTAGVPDDNIFGPVPPNNNLFIQFFAGFYIITMCLIIVHFAHPADNNRLTLYNSLARINARSGD